MAARLLRIEAAVFALITIYISCKAQFPTESSIKTWTKDLKQSLDEYVSNVLGEAQLQQSYNSYDASKVQWKAVNGEDLVEETANKLGLEVLGKKIEALKKSVKAAEEIAAISPKDDSLTIDNYKFNNAKTLDKSTLAYSPKFGKGINETISSVHIPVEIYYGDKDILNGLKWTEGLDDVWKQNAEDDPNLLWQYFGGQKGFLRSYPANAWTEAKPDLYDVRRRPWYTQGSSSPKNMMILVDTSGSTTGEALQLMKETVKQLLETLGENDFVAVANYSKTEEIQDTVRYVSECFQGFVQATHRNKQVLKEAVMDLQASGMAKWEDALEFAFKAFKEFEQDEKNSSMNNVGADCNRIIMVLTDGATAKDEAATVLNRENPDKRIRIFTYAIGKTAAAIEAVRWLACKNRGYFSKIPAMGAIRTTVQEHVAVVARPLVLQSRAYIQESDVYEDALVWWQLVNSQVM
ncbi:voltage-dependent calcium channel subunit alpha-2/delta-1 [Lingula anatina]|uniref:Voltage-dependent calcium channel subunit alpha-2/delta-1 n=1 Tax=Lingula anatina TaxID=7574 RepID=A0A1S3JP64_LINAN|nr:voltage-dependent calcium channel subunit alpha-2/delta-1 [Lingula anatina]|eukprot:XP_013411926.1 voltage-dependent calcium channel subunit alpha-2/delta-1 [Lingula anatina]